MAAPYQYELRMKVIEAIEQGQKKSEVARRFGISRNTIYLWLKRREITGSIDPALHYQKGSNPKITDWEKFEAFLEKHQGKTEQEMAEAWEEPISRHTIHRSIEKLNYAKQFPHLVKKKCSLQGRQRSNGRQGEQGNDFSSPSSPK